jgi:hypothetical protein
VREKERKGQTTDDSMVKAAVERGEQELYASKQYARKVRKAVRLKLKKSGPLATSPIWSPIQRSTSGLASVSERLKPGGYREA